MYNPSGNWLEQIKQLVKEMVDNRSFVLEGIVTSVDPNPPYKVKVMLQPHEIETGWMRVATPYAGNGFGLILPPPEEQTPVKVIFDLGNPNAGTVIACMFNINNAMPNVPIGTAGLVHKSGSSILIASDGLITIHGKNSSQSW